MGVDLRPALNPTLLRRGLEPPWRHLDVVTETKSTNADLIARAVAGDDVDGVVLIAEHQTAGRGRMGRSWSAAPRAQITLSVAVGVRDVPAAGWGWLPLAGGLAVVDAVAAITGIEAGLKWPNDVLVGDRKLAGILAEVASPNPVIVLGIGLNVTLTPDEAGEPSAISLLDLGVEAPDRDALVARLLHELGRRVHVWRHVGGGGLSDDYRARSLTIGNVVRATLAGGREVVGTARSVDERGRLCIESAGGTVAVSAGDVTHLRPRL
jgi:BirA family transcriptional regulator, biotin operon repressor / biotin---[acetyl-CoA-carboxylase] ligase